MYRCSPPPMIHLPPAARILMLDRCSLSPRKRPPRSGTPSIVVASSPLVSRSVAGSPASATMSRHGGVPGSSWDGGR